MGIRSSTGLGFYSVVTQLAFGAFATLLRAQWLDAFPHYICTASACCGTGRLCGGHRQMLQEYTHATGTLSATVLLQWA